MNVKLKKFSRALNANSPLKSGHNSHDNPDLVNYKYPYKPILILAIIHSISVDGLFNHDICLESNEKLLKVYYDLLMNHDVLAKYLVTHKSKEGWHLGFDSNIKTSIIKNIFEMPAIKLYTEGDDFWTFNVKKHTIKLNFNFKNNEEKSAIKDELVDLAYNCLIKCIPDYASLTLSEIMEYPEVLKQQIITDSEDTFTKVKVRKYQHIFSKQVKDRDLKCKICCIEVPSLLEACHIKPDADCKNAFEKFTEDNGITLCSNHHKLFDNGFFSFDEHWKVIISNQFNYHDADILIKTFEPCYMNLPSERYFENVYVKFHRENIFLK